jgi:protein-disulfide isomerase-like protein with CxxC motif
MTVQDLPRDVRLQEAALAALHLHQPTFTTDVRQPTHQGLLSSLSLSRGLANTHCQAQSQSEPARQHQPAQQQHMKERVAIAATQLLSRARKHMCLPGGYGNHVL